MIIESLLDTDLYKLTMQQAVFHNYPKAEVEYEFVCRDQDNPLGHLCGEVDHELLHFCRLRFTSDDIEYLGTLGLFSNDYLQFLENFSPTWNGTEIGVHPYKRDGDVRTDLVIKVKGPWWQTILFEVPILAIVNEVYYRQKFRGMGAAKSSHIISDAENRLQDKIQTLINTGSPNLRIMEFGTRRRQSRGWQEIVLKRLLDIDRWGTGGQHWNPIAGTSNVLLAKKFGIQPLGTMAHEWLQAHQALVPLRDSQRVALETWMMEYRGKLGIALTDCIGTDAFLRDFDLLLAKAYDGVRHDSGPPQEWAEKMVKHYASLNIDPMTKTLVFSDGLTIDKAIYLNKSLQGITNTVFGIGTSLTNDSMLRPISIVMKMTRCNGQPVAKISDEPGKSICRDTGYMEHLKRTFGV